MRGRKSALVVLLTRQESDQMDQWIHSTKTPAGHIGCEHAIGRLKVFRIFLERYRNRRKRFGLRFNLIAAICNMERDE